VTQYPTSVVAGVQRPPIKTSNTPYLEVTRSLPLWPRRIVVQWVLRNPGAATGYDFNVYRSGSDEGPWELLTTTPLADVFFFVDDAFSANLETGMPDLLSITRNVVYKITAQVHGQSNPVIYSSIGELDPYLDQRRWGIARKLIRDCHISLKRAVGTEVAYLRRRYWGTRCPVCLTTTGMSVKANCTTCFGTAFVGGYWNPVYGYAQMASIPVSTTLAIQGEKDVRKTHIIAGNYPALEKNDLVVFMRSGHRFIIEQSNTTQIHNYDIHSELMVSELSPSSIEFGINVEPWREPCWWV